MNLEQAYELGRRYAVKTAQAKGSAEAKARMQYTGPGGGTVYDGNGPATPKQLLEHDRVIKQYKNDTKPDPVTGKKPNPIHIRRSALNRVDPG